MPFFLAYLSLAEALGSKAAGSVGQVHMLTDLDVVLERNVLDFDVFIRPLVEELAGTVGAGQDVSGQVNRNHAKQIKRQSELNCLKECIIDKKVCAW